MTGPEPAGGRAAGGPTGTPQIVAAGACGAGPAWDAGACGAGACAAAAGAHRPSDAATARRRLVMERMLLILSKRLSLQDLRRGRPESGRIRRGMDGLTIYGFP